ncbi:MAG: diheme cytochrome c [Magnetococcales bacterium]|nr:diheme cytochrome c [Magnetococcales bacterium]
MKTGKTILGGMLFIILFGGSLLLGMQTVFGDGPGIGKREGRDRNDTDKHESWEWRPNPVVAVGTDNSAYLKECGSCHFAIQPGWLPAQSWKTLMDGLSNHFGENAEIDAKTREALTTYLTSNALDHDSKGASRTSAQGMESGGDPLRITTTRFFQHEHGKIPAHMVKDNPKVGSWIRCDACHTDAGKGNFKDHGITIPGFGRWDD